MPIGTMIYLSLDTISYIIFDLLVTLLLFDFKKSRKLSYTVLVIGTIINNVDNSIASVYLFDPNHFFNSPAYLISDYLLWFAFEICFLCLFVKGHPVRNFVIWNISGFTVFPIMAVFTLIRKGLDLGPSLMYSTSLKDCSAIAVTIISLLLTYFLLKILWKKLRQRILTAPLIFYWCIAAVFFLSVSTFTFLSDSAPQNFTGGIPATINIFASLFAVFILLALAGILSISIMEYRNTNRNLQLMETEMALQHTYYKTVQAVQLQIRSLRHDLSNHLEVMEQLASNGGRADDYREKLNACCLGIEREAQAMLQWRRLRLSGLTPREAYTIFAYLDLLLKNQGLTWEMVVIENNTAQDGAVLVVTFPVTNPPRGWKRKAKRDPYFLLIRQVAGRYKGTVGWELEKERFRFVVKMKSKKEDGMSHPERV